MQHLTIRLLCVSRSCRGYKKADMFLCMSRIPGCVRSSWVPLQFECQVTSLFKVARGGRPLAVPFHCLQVLVGLLCPPNAKMAPRLSPGGCIQCVPLLSGCSTTFCDNEHCQRSQFRHCIVDTFVAALTGALRHLGHDPVLLDHFLSTPADAIDTQNTRASSARMVSYCAA